MKVTAKALKAPLAQQPNRTRFTLCTCYQESNDPLLEHVKSCPCYSKRTVTIQDWVNDGDTFFQVLNRIVTHGACFTCDSTDISIQETHLSTSTLSVHCKACNNIQHIVTFEGQKMTTKMGKPV